MRIKNFRIGLLFIFLMAFCTLPILSQTSITVVGTNTYPDDFFAVQNAVDIYDIVTLEGTFDFGQQDPAGCVVIDRESVTLMANPSTGATINGIGGSYWGFHVAIAIKAPGVTISGLTINMNHPYWHAEGIIIATRGEVVQASDKIIKIEKNRITADGYAILSYYTGGWPIVIGGSESTGNVLTGLMGCYMNWIGYAVDENYEFVQMSSPVEISYNQITSLYRDGILIYGWNTGGSNDPEYGDNGPVQIKRNTVMMNAPYSVDTIAISIGRSAQGLNHCEVAENAIGGNCAIGIIKGPYGYDNQIVGNDLSGLTTGFLQIGVMSRETIVANNILGPVYMVDEYSVALLLWSANLHPPSTPDPLPIENCTIMDNDYRLTGLPGWSSSGNGCIMLLSGNPWSGLPGIGIMNNLINETGRFPQGTGGTSKHGLIVEDPNIYNNRVIGLPTNYISDPGIGQRMKEAYKVIVERFSQAEQAIQNELR